MTTVVVAGALANKHRQGGSIWVRLSWAEALRSLGFDVLFVEQIAAADCVDLLGAPAPFTASANATTFRNVMAAFGFEGKSALVCPDGGQLIGMGRDELLDRLREAALLVNISGHLRWPPALARLPRRVYVDLDPGYTQIWHAAGNAAVADLDRHELHFTIGANVGTPACELPSGGLRWRPIRQPVVLERWASRRSAFTGFTTVAGWRGAYGRQSWKGRSYGLKVHQFRRFAELPALAREPFAIALDIHRDDGADLQRLRRSGWQLRDPALVADVDGFRRFVQGSGAEFSAAQGIYVETRSGWFSDRTVRYLAAGKPALVQDTGFGEQLPVGEGLLSFRDLDEARAGVREIVANYEHHSTAARRVAERCFAPAAALAPLIEAAGIAP